MEIKELLNGYLGKFQIKEPAKNEERKRLIHELSEVTGRTKKGIHFQTIHFPDSWLQDALSYCRHYSNPKLRNMKFGEFIKQSKIK